MKKETAINLLEDIKQTLIKNGKERALKDVKIYRKGIQIATNEKIKNLIAKHCEYIEKYGENHRKTLKISQKINEEMQKIYKN